MSVEQEYCLDPITQSECYSTNPHNLTNGQAVFFVVLPKFMNVDIRIVIGEFELNLSDFPNILSLYKHNLRKWGSLNLCSYFGKT